MCSPLFPKVSFKGGSNIPFLWLQPKARKVLTCFARIIFLCFVLLFVLYLFPKVWKEVRDDNNKDVDWVLIGYDGDSKSDMTVLDKGNGGVAAISSKLPSDVPVFGGIRLTKGRFVSFCYIGEDVPGIKRGRTLMFKNGECKMSNV